jgi:hypothetical protein
MVYADRCGTVWSQCQFRCYRHHATAGRVSQGHNYVFGNYGCFHHDVIAISDGRLRRWLRPENDFGRCKPLSDVLQNGSHVEHVHQPGDIRFHVAPVSYGVNEGLHYFILLFTEWIMGYDLKYCI